MQIAVCDDSREYLNVMEEYFDKLTDIKFDYDLFESGEDLIRLYETDYADYDAIFLDMEMKKLDGIETANLIRKKDKHVIIVFVTNHTKYMQKSFECAPFRFLVKPISFDDLQKVFDEIYFKLNEERKTFVFCENKIRIRLFCDDIIFFENRSHWILIHTKERIYKICKSLSDLYSNLDKSMFCRVYKSFIINYNYVKAIKENDIILYEYDIPIPLSRTYKKELVNGLINFKERKYLI